MKIIYWKEREEQGMEEKYKRKNEGERKEDTDSGSCCLVVAEVIKGKELG